MKETILLSKTLIKNGFRKGYNEKSKAGIYVFILVYFAIFTIYVSTTALELLRDILLEELFLQIVLLINTVIVFMQCIISSLNMFFFSNDLEYILPLPVKAKSVYGAKLNLLIATEYIFEVLIFLAPLMYFGVFMDLGILYFIKAAIVMITLPIICSSIMAFIMVRIASCLKFLKNKDRVQYMSIVMLVIILLFVSVISSGENTNAGISDAQVLDFVFSMQESIEGNKILGSFINVFTKFLVSNDNVVVFKNFGLILLMVWITYIGLTKLNHKAYMKNISINFNDGKKVNTKINKVKDIKANSLNKSYVKKEMLTMVRTPVFFMQCIMPVFIVPIIMFMPFILNINNLEALDMPSLEVLKDSVISVEGVSIILTIMQILYIMNIIPVTAVSRDNLNATFMKTIPVSYYKQCKYKVKPGIIFNMIPIIYLFIVSIFVFEVQVQFFIAIAITLILMNIVESYIGILIDLKSPKIGWDSETTAVKQNFNIVINYFAAIALCFMLVVIVIVSKLNLMMTLLLLDVILLVIYFALIMYIKKKDGKLFTKIY